jgi:hypothetical protein
MQNQIFEAALGIANPWYVKGIDFDAEQKSLSIHIDFVDWPCRPPRSAREVMIGSLPSKKSGRCPRGIARCIAADIRIVPLPLVVQETAVAGDHRECRGVTGLVVLNSRLDGNYRHGLQQVRNIYFAHTSAARPQFVL